MLRDLGVRSKLLVLLSVPLLLVLALSSLIVGDGLAGARAAARVEQLAVTSGELNTLVHGLQAERAATAVWVRAQTPENQDRLLTQRTNVDAAVLALETRIADMALVELSPGLAEGFAAAARQHEGLTTLRSRADVAKTFGRELSDAYDQVIAVDLALPPLVALAAKDGALAASLRSYGILATAIEQSARERDLVATAFATTSLTRTGYAQLAGTIATADSALRAFESAADPEQLGRLRAGLAASDTARLDGLRLRAGDLLALETAPTDPAEWTDVATGRIDALVAVESSLVADVELAAGERVSALRGQVALVAALAALAFGIALGVALLLARRMVEPLLTLTRAATDTADKLPELVERMQRPDAEPVTHTPIAVTTNDEFGRLAAAFNTVNDATVRVASEQAELRAGVAMFVNVARRNQILLGRQLTFIDVMEGSEENPDTLDNLFKLDHLATRMRRNAESLLVLAGLDSTRRLREGLVLSDVIRTAVSEIEAYDRVDLAVAEDAKLHGRTALSVAHLLAELLENATHFSNPDTRVLVSCAPGNGGVEVTVTDHGLGMGADELVAANAAITSPASAAVAVGQRLGFSVVGRLAQRMGIAVSVRPGAAPDAVTGLADLSFGTVVTLTLPETLFEGSVTTRPARPDDLPAPAPVSAPRELAPVAALPVTALPVTALPEETAAVPPVPAVVPIPAPQPPTQPVRAASAAPAIDILPGGSGSRRRQRRTAPPTSPAYVPPVTTTADAEVLAAFVGSAPLPTRTPAEPAQAAVLTESEAGYAPSQVAAPAAVPLPLPSAPGAAGGLARRVRPPDGAPAQPAEVLPEPIAAGDRSRTASDVRGMLSGFREGVERGRSTPAQPGSTPDSPAEQ